MIKTIVIVALSCLVFFSGMAQDTASVQTKDAREKAVFIYKKDSLYFEKPNLIRNLRSVPSDILGIARSPFEKKNWISLSVITAGTVLLISKDEEIIKSVRATSDEIRLVPQTDYDIAWKIGQTKILKIPKNTNTLLYQLGEGGTSMILAGGMLIYGKLVTDIRATNTAYDLAETFLSMGITTQILKRISGRESPFLASKAGGKWRPFPSFGEFQRNTSAYDAFPSGHLATLMATITVLSYNYPEKKWIKPVGYTLMFLSSWAMMNTEVHWAGDYPLAIAVGYLSGKITAWRHRPKNIDHARSVFL